MQLHWRHQDPEHGAGGLKGPFGHASGAFLINNFKQTLIAHHRLQQAPTPGFVILEGKPSAATTASSEVNNRSSNPNITSLTLVTKSSHIKSYMIFLSRIRSNT